jgi:HKD family nuclease
MRVRTLTQPHSQLGPELEELLDDETFELIVFVSAFVALRTILRLRERLLRQVEEGTQLRFTVGIDLGGTSREVLQELLRWPCETVVFHNPIPRATFHPKLYLLKGRFGATLFVGSNNLTDGGLYTNYEAATRMDFDLRSERPTFEEFVEPLQRFISPEGPTVQPLTQELIDTLIARGMLPSEAEARARRQHEFGEREGRGRDVPANPFGASPIPFPPLLTQAERGDEPVPPVSPTPPTSTTPAAPPTAPTAPAPPPAPPTRPAAPAPAATPTVPTRARVLVWRKAPLPKTDAQYVPPGSNSNPVGGVRLTKAGFENPPGTLIDQTTYFRRLFADYAWEQEPGKHDDQEHTFVPMRVIIRGRDYGVRHFEISHKPSGEAGQANYTTILRWGREFVPIVQRERLTGSALSLYETTDPDVRFLLEIT